MALNYDTRTLAIGDDIITEIGFDFLVKKKSDVLLSIVETGQDTIRFRGDDTTYLTDLTFDSVEGGGIVTLAAPLATGKALYVDLDVQESDQTAIFRIVTNYLTSFRSIERALDYIVTQIQTLYRWNERSLKFNRSINTFDFDPTMPDGLVGSVSKALVTNSTGDGFAVGPSAGEISNAQTYATQAATSATAATAAQTAAEAAQAAAEIARDEAVASGGIEIVGTRAAPTNITTSIPFVSVSYNTRNFVVATGDVSLTDNPRIAAGTIVGQCLKLQYVGAGSITIPDGQGVDQSGSTQQLVDGSIREYAWDGTNWILELSNNV